ncbi:hypothetical protein ACFOVU_20335 [Nocardiopsis sediminis]|uniref:Uncharacterized protein n=1 Tax=Nocardiopsis sediminis TaxID=1778267 RepID=A0ABV8FQC6_9ACTN
MAIDHRDESDEPSDQGYPPEFFRGPFFVGYTEGSVIGQAVGEATAVLLVLYARRIKVPRSLHERITRCRDIATLDQWVQRAVTVETVEELFA